MPPFQASPRTDLARWKLSVKEGRQFWSFIESSVNPQFKQNACERYWLGLEDENLAAKPADYTAPSRPLEAARKTVNFLTEIQTEDGHWAGEYGGPMFLIPGLAICWYVTGRRNDVLNEYQRIEMIRYLRNMETKQGGWGIHTASPPTIFGTVLNYVALRIFGIAPDDPVMLRARNWLHANGGATGIPAWGKFWLSVLNCYNWEGMNPVTPELWLLPYWVPFHPGRMWVHTRMVYLPMGWLYGKRWSAPVDDLISSLREELYTEPYEKIQWRSHRNKINPIDLYAPHTRLAEILFDVLYVYECFPLSFLRKKALDHTYELVQKEDWNTDFLDIGPVNKAMNMIVVYVKECEDNENAGRGYIPGEGFERHVDRVKDFLWLGREGMMMNGTNGVQLWDTAFAVQAVLEAGFATDPEIYPSMKMALEFLEVTQIRRNAPHESYREVSKGAWPFSSRDQSYTVSDCTAEGLKTALLLQELKEFPKLISDDRLFDAVNVLLSMQNTDGGFASYEKARSGEWLEWLNPAEVFGKIMIEYSYPECTTAVVLALTTFKKQFPDHRRQEIDYTIIRAVHFIKSSQRPDGSWYGSWAICFTYAMMFALESLASIGEYYDNSPTVRLACEFLLSKQKEDGGWGESYKSCELVEYVQEEESQVVNTSWALLALMSAKYPDEEPIRKGIKLLMSKQLPSGAYKQEKIEGVFNKNCMIAYPNYKFYFPVWAMGKYARLYNNPVIN
ncbi:terpene synthase [Paraphysoderma sedebokerense]|nr:terpene synthase [Paraphysoderma sedebokerense]